MKKDNIVLLEIELSPCFQHKSAQIKAKHIVNIISDVFFLCRNTVDRISKVLDHESR